jgi:hypothetical protein
MFGARGITDYFQDLFLFYAERRSMHGRIVLIDYSPVEFIDEFDHDSSMKIYRTLRQDRRETDHLSLKEE